MNINYKKYKLFFILLFIGFILPTTLIGQGYGKYKFTMNLDNFKNLKSNYVKLEFYSVNSNGETLLTDWKYTYVGSANQLNPNPGDNYDVEIKATDPIVKEYSTQSNDIPYKIKIEGLYFSKMNNGTSGVTSTVSYITLNRNNPYINESFEKDDSNNYFLPCLDFKVNIELIPKSIELKYYTGNGLVTESSSSNLLPDNDIITLKATKGFVESTYEWQYQVYGENVWHNMPSNIQYKEGRSAVTFKGLDLFSKEEYNTLVIQNKNILFRVKAITDGKRNENDYNIIALRATYSVPKIVNYEIKRGCNKSNTSSIRIFLERALLKGESLTFTYGNESIMYNTGLDDDNSFIISNLKPGKYSFKLSGTINNGYETYNGSDKHILEDVEITELLPISLSLESEKVSCNGGRDGEIIFRVSGGSGNFKAILTNSSDITRIEEFSTGVFRMQGLAAGKYELCIEDSNGCQEKDERGNPKFYKINITQPNEPVSIETIEIVNPLADSSLDGSIYILVKGGSPSNGYNVQLIRRSDNKVFRPTEIIEGTNYKYKFNNISKGDYLAVAGDMYYDTLKPLDIQNNNGCMSALPITVTAPSAIKINLEETNFVSCYGKADGEITAHVSGGKQIVGKQLPYIYTWYKISGKNREELVFNTDSTAHNLGSGNYIVKITDDNEISKESEIFTLKQPDSLVIKFDTKLPSVSTGNGYIKAVVSGGTAPYTYSWNKEGESSDKLIISESGSYFVRVIDSRGCGIAKEYELIIPEAIKIEPILTNPTCYGQSNGSIKLIISGGTAPYNIQWEDDKSSNVGFERYNLRAGEYKATITDSVGYTISYRAQLIQPEQLIVTLSEPFTLCKGQSRMLTASSSQENITYRWLKDGLFLEETTSNLNVSQAGIYRVIAKNNTGCEASAEVEIQVGNEELPIDITMPSRVSVGMPIHAVNISKIKADKIEWVLPPEAVINKENDNELIFSINKSGKYTISVIGYKGDCSASISQNLEVLDEKINLPDEKDTPLIRQFLITPNPTKGEFSVRVELSDTVDFTLTLYSPTKVVMDKKEVKSSNNKTFEYELRGETEGVFTLELSVLGEKSILYITKQK